MRLEDNLGLFADRLPQCGHVFDPAPDCLFVIEAAFAPDRRNPQYFPTFIQQLARLFD